MAEVSGHVQQQQAAAIAPRKTARPAEAPAHPPVRRERCTKAAQSISALGRSLYCGRHTWLKAGDLNGTLGSLVDL